MTLERMTAAVDRQNEDDLNYEPIAPAFEDSIALKAARELIFKGLERPNGYTEPVLHARRRKRKVGGVITQNSEMSSTTQGRRWRSGTDQSGRLALTYSRASKTEASRADLD